MFEVMIGWLKDIVLKHQLVAASRKKKSLYKNSKVRDIFRTPRNIYDVA